MSRPRLGRNDPCPCGSGRKAKKCCGPAKKATASIEELDINLIEALTQYAKTRHGRERVNALLDDAPCDPDREDFELLSVDWALYRADLGDGSVAAKYLDEEGVSLSARERAWIRAKQQAWFGVWEVRAVLAGGRLELEDHLTGTRRVIHDLAAWKDLEPHDTLCEQVIDFEGVSVLAGGHPTMLPCDSARDVLDRLCAESTLDLDGHVAAADLDADLTRLLLECWQREADDLYGPTAGVCNADGDELMFAQDSFTIQAGARDRVVELLAGLSGFQRQQDDVRLEGFQRLVDDPILYDVLRPSDPRSPHGDGTVVGSVVVDGDTLTVETNSLERAESLCERLAAVCGDLVDYVDSLATPIDLESLTRGPGGSLAGADHDETLARSEEEENL